MMQEHSFAECSCSRNGTTVGIDHTGSLNIFYLLSLSRKYGHDDGKTNGELFIRNAI